MSQVFHRRNRSDDKASLKSGAPVVVGTQTAETIISAFRSGQKTASQSQLAAQPSFASASMLFGPPSLIAESSLRTTSIEQPHTAEDTRKSKTFLASLGSTSMLSLSKSRLPASTDATWEGVWQELGARILPLFNGEGPKGVMEDLNATLRNLLKGMPLMALVERIRTELLTCGMEILNTKLQGVADEKLSVRMAEMWTFFFGSVLPYIQGICLPIQTELINVASSVDIRTLALQSFRDSVLFPQLAKLKEMLLKQLSAAEMRGSPDVLPRLMQMLNVLSMVRDNQQIYILNTLEMVNAGYEKRRESTHLRRQAFCAITWSNQSKCDITAEAISLSARFLAFADVEKQLHLWYLSDDAKWMLRHTWSIPKRACRLSFTPNDDALIVADRFGDVYRLSIDVADMSNIKLNQETLIMGHVSMILDMSLNKDNQYIITSDRDEKIRVSRFPDAYQIHTFCLGHKQFVSTINIKHDDPSKLLSGGGDGQIIEWTWRDAKITRHITIPSPPSLAEPESSEAKEPAIVRKVTSYRGSIFVIMERDRALYVVPSESDNVSRVPLTGYPLDMCVDERNGKVWITMLPDDEKGPFVSAWLINDQHEMNLINTESSPLNSSDVFEAKEDTNPIDAAVYLTMEQQRKYPHTTKREGSDEGEDEKRPSKRKK